MAMTIRNKGIERKIRDIGKATGEGPSAVIGRLVDREYRERSAETEDERIARRLESMDEWIKSLPPITDEERREIDRIMEDMYDGNGLPQ